MIAPVCGGDEVIIEVCGTLVSRPYVDMTVEMMTRPPWRLPIWPEGNRFRAAHAGACGWTEYVREYEIEPDASAASYSFAAAAITAGSVSVLGLPEQSLQGDVRFIDVLVAMGCKVIRQKETITVSSGGSLHGIDIDMNDISDTVMTL